MCSMMQPPAGLSLSPFFKVHLQSLFEMLDTMHGISVYHMEVQAAAASWAADRTSQCTSTHAADMTHTASLLGSTGIERHHQPPKQTTNHSMACLTCRAAVRQLLGAGVAVLHGFRVSRAWHCGTWGCIRGCNCCSYMQTTQVEKLCSCTTGAAEDVHCDWLL